MDDRQQRLPEQDGQSVLVGFPDMKVVNQMRIGWGLKGADGSPAQNAAYFSPWELLTFDAKKEGFGDIQVDLTPRKAAAVAAVKPTVEEGERMYQMFGCMACHSTDGTLVGKVGPSWKGLFGSERDIAKGTKGKFKADEAYLRESITQSERQSRERLREIRHRHAHLRRDLERLTDREPDFVHQEFEVVRKERGGSVQPSSAARRLVLFRAWFYSGQREARLSVVSNSTSTSTILRRCWSTCQEVKFDGAAFETKQVFFHSKDDAKVPMFIVHKKGPPARRLESDAALRLRRLQHQHDSRGLLVGACMTQRPELYAAALPAVGVLDMLRFEKFTIGWGWKSDYGTVENKAEFNALLKYSPYHNLKPGTSYPATLVLTSDHDDRVVPAHSFKFGACLQACQAKDGPPVLIRIETSAGHGAGTALNKTIEKAADEWAFLVKALGMKD
jgi:cytochrome c551/c552